MIIRPAIETDCSLLAEIDRQSNPSPWSAAQFQTALNNRFDTVLIGEYQQQAAGFIVWQTIPDESELHLIATAPQYRRMGFASQLLERWLADSAEHKIARLFLEVRAGNTPAQELYKKYGFQAYAVRKNYYALPNHTYEDAVLMEKIC
ncbi:ribosomal protein S18-alanine N-acetyltransferase [Neisseria weaveri]|uniref:[Ribosomal protein bS18]-alanine N-acetyltransferase n=1 Tax=Neisseria weaveri TaxID=28091 RepID=A0A448VM52_9NEIS|nr:ribosomal protein S18-alanine N-acetyltransferase [Neisseria weaveri]EGV35740.1 ribosomal-protein-alanine acetyltransferase [Neisseria weaveri ATCC 51223]SAY51605.1 acetyltransferase [Neisseria weaveri]VEJ50821.1 acetyltransferase [Neisseria weaveri]